jgi:2-polyprenyl-3-methyl-5-hydroxy-6-metoxy-1,4-benzoquinol methylase
MTDACLACGSTQRSLWTDATDAEYRSVSDHFKYWECTDCHSLSIDPCPTERLEEIYPSSYYSYARPDAQLINRIKMALDKRLLRSVLRRCPGSQLAVLDVGGGSGWMLDVARRADARVSKTLVVDIDARARDQAEAAGHQFFLGPIEAFSGDEKFDLVLMLNLIEHVADPVNVLRSARDRLKPGGALLIKTPNYDSLDARLFRKTYWGGLHCPRHWVIFTPESIRRVAASAGFEVRRLDLTQGAPFWTWSVLDRLERRGWIKLSEQHPMHEHVLTPLLMAFFGALDSVRGLCMKTSQMFVVLHEPRGTRD